MQILNLTLSLVGLTALRYRCHEMPAPARFSSRCPVSLRTTQLSARDSDLNLNLTSSLIGQVPGSLIPHFFDTLARRGRLGLHLAASGEDAHHIAEAAFKATALALRQAIELDPERAGVASTKGVL